MTDGAEEWDDSLSLSVSDGTLLLASTKYLTFSSGANGSSSMTVEGEPYYINLALNGLIYTPNALYSGSDTLQISDENTFDTFTASAAVALTVNAPPSIAASAAVDVAVNQRYIFNNAILVTDAAASSTSDTVSLSVTNGILEFGPLTGLTIVSGATNSPSIALSGSVANLNSGLNMIYIPNSNYLGSDALQVSVTDSLDDLSASATVSIAVAVPPALTVPHYEAVPADSSYTFAAGAITLTDINASGTSDSLLLFSPYGTLTMGSTTGLTFVSGSNDSGSMTVNGTMANLTAAVAGLVYTPKFNYLGSDSVFVTLQNAVSGLETTAEVNIDVIAPLPPSIAAPVAINLNENASYTFASASIALTDAAASGISDSLSLSVADGKLTLGSTTGLTFGSGANRTSSMTVTGTLANLDAALNGLVYAPIAGYSGADSLQMSVNDTGDNLTGSAAVSITVNAPPAVTAPATASVNENASLTFSGTISIADAAASATSDSLTLSIGHGKLTLGSTTGLTFSSGANGTSSMTITGTVANLNAALNGLVEAPNSGYSGADSLHIFLADSGDGLSNSATVAITVNAPPSVTAPAAASVNENASLTFSGTISITDAAASGTSDSLTLRVTQGTLTLGSITGLTFSAGANASPSMTVTGTLASLNAALSGLTYKPTAGYSGSDSLFVSVTNSGDNQSTSASAALTVIFIPPPSISAPTNASLNPNGSLVFSSANGTAITVADSGPGSNTDSLTLMVTHGTVTLSTTSGLTVTAGLNGSSSITVVGAVANLNAALSALTYKPITGYSGSDSLAISLKDSADSLSASANVALTVSNPPAITAPATATVLISASLTFSTPNKNAISIADVNAGSAVEPLTLTATDGTLTLGSTTGITFTSGGNNSASMTINGTLANLNAALSGLTFTPAKIGSGTVVLSYTDIGDGLMATATINITVSKGVTKLGGGSPGNAPSPAVARAGSVSGPTGGSTVAPAATLTTANGATDNSAMPPDALTQWQGLAAAVDVLSG
jgi:hypothetical protein